MKDTLAVLLKNPRTTAVALIAIAGALHDPSKIDADKLEIILLAIGLFFARDARAGDTQR